MKLRSHVLLKYPDFLFYFIGRFISAIGDKVFTIAMSVWVVSENSPSVKFHLGFLLAMNTLPVVIFGPFAGAIADRFNRKICMLIADFVRFSVLLIALILLLNKKLGIPQMYVICFLLATFVPLFESAAGASITHFVEENDISKAVALDGSVVNLSEIIGASLGGVLVALFHFKGALIFNALTFLCSFIMISLIRAELSSNKDEKDSYFNEICEGFSYLLNNKPLFSLFLMFAAVNFFTAPVFVLIPLLVKFKFAIPLARWVAAYETSLALGAGTMAILLSFKVLFKKVYTGIAICLGIFGTGYILTGISPVPFSVCIWLFLSGAALATINTLAIGLFQATIPDSVKGRIFALLTTVCFAAIPISYIITGYVSNFCSAANLFFINGVMVVIMGFILLFLPRINVD